MKALDLFCGAGGAGEGLRRAGFIVHGVDLRPQPNNPHAFVEADAMTYPLDGYDFIWASPPCQTHTAYRRRGGGVGDKYECHIAALRDRLRLSGIPYVIENVVGAPLESPTLLCGSMFGLDVQRHRLFEASFPMFSPLCDHSRWTARFPCATNRTNKRKTVEIGVWRIPLNVQRAAMGIDWMTLAELTLAIPPAYSEWVGRQWLTERERERHTPCLA